MTHIKLYRSNSIEELADALAANIKSPIASPMASEIILVQSLGMAKWLNLELAQRMGVWANGSLLFPNRFINKLFATVLPDVDEKLLLEREMMTWLILDRLTFLAHQSPAADMAIFAREPDFDPMADSEESAIEYSDNAEKLSLAHLSDYCNGENGDFRRFQLARQLAMTYDQYLLYRPDVVTSWESSKIKGCASYKKDEEWQCRLWRSICKGKVESRDDSICKINPDGESKVTHKAARKKAFLAIMDGQIHAERLPERISVFGIPSLPLFHLDILASLAGLMDVSFYVMTPAQGYFSDLKSAKERMKRENIFGYTGLAADLLHIETGNPLLASFGRAGADFMESLLNYDNLEDIDQNFVQPAGDTILSMVQQDILLMRDRKKHPLSSGQARGDRSVVVNSCHSPMREVEVLNDYLLELFDSNPHITPADVLVMTPDIESYAPLVRAIFTTPEDERLKIPFSIADLGIKSVSRSVDVFMNILSLPQSRFEASFIMDILECDDVARCFALEPGDIDLVKEWIKETAIRWGRDGNYREGIGLPRFEENSWRAGLDRLMAGYAMTGRGEKFFIKNLHSSGVDTNTHTDTTVNSMNFLSDDGIDNTSNRIKILPCDSVEGSSSRVLGSLSRFFNILSDTEEKIAKEMCLSDWSDFLMDVIDKFFLPDGDETSMVQEIRNALDDLRRMEEITGFHLPVSSTIIKSWCDQAIGKEYRDSNFLNGGVTFCAMLPMRSIPAKVICIIGLNYGIFPRIDSSPNFDLIREYPRRGDRSLRNEDRYLFLETLISARERIYLSYTGQGIEDNSTIPPSVVISELLDYLDQGFVVNDDSVSLKRGEQNSKPLSSYILTQHRLQPFSPAYFDGSTQAESRLFSYSRGNFLAASALRAKKRELKPFITKG